VITARHSRCHLAITYACCGDKDSVLEQLSSLSKVPSDVNYGTLRLDPFWDPLRGDLGFDKIIAVPRAEGEEVIRKA
jgi:hypothetical protein